MYLVKYILPQRRALHGTVNVNVHVNVYVTRALIGRLSRGCNARGNGVEKAPGYKARECTILERNRG